MDDPINPALYVTFQKAIKVWEDNFPWNPRIMKITFIYPFQNKIVQTLGNLFMSSCLLLLLITTLLKLFKIIQNEVEGSTVIETIFQSIAYAAMILCYTIMVIYKKDIYMGSVLMSRMFAESEDVQQMKVDYHRKGYILTNIQAGSILLLLVSFGTAPVVIPPFLTWALPGNRTFEKTLPLRMEFFVDEEEYFYSIFAVQFVFIFIYGLLIASMNYIQCSAILFIMCEIHSYRYKLEKISKAYKWKMSINEENANKWICEQLKDLVRCHQLCIEYYWLFQKKSDPMMFVILSGSSGLVVMAGTSMVLLVETNLTGALEMLFVFCITLFLIIFICIPSQILKNSSEDFFITSCAMNGQIHSRKIRKMLLLIMMRTMKPFVLTAGSTIELNLETCSTIIKSSISYVAALRSIYTSV